MAYTTINKSTDYFNTKLYTGTGSELAITGVGFQPDWTWIKARNVAYDNNVFDAVRGSTKRIMTNQTNAESTQAQMCKSFDSDGFTLGTDGGVNENNTRNYAAWNWKANGAGSSNTDGNGITSTVSANTTSRFSIVKYTGTGNAAHTIGHGLGVKPACVIMRPLGYSGAWWIAHENLSTDNLLEFNGNAQANISSFGGGGLKYSTFTTSVIGGGNGSSNSDLWNKSGEDYIAYCFAKKTGYNKFGSFTGNGSATDGTFIYTGFKPAWFMIKKINGSGESWNIQDSTRSAINPVTHELVADGNNVEYTSGSRGDFLSNGFKLRTTSGGYNNSSSTYIYMAFGQSIVGSNNIPATAR